MESFVDTATSRSPPRMAHLRTWRLTQTEVFKASLVLKTT